MTYQHGKEQRLIDKEKELHLRWMRLQGYLLQRKDPCGKCNSS